MVSILLSLLRKRGIRCFHQNKVKLVKNMDKLFKSLLLHIISHSSSSMITKCQNEHHAGLLGDNSSQGTEGNENVSSNGIKSIEANGETVLVEKVDACSSTLTPCSVLSMYHVKAEVDYPDHNLITSQGNGVEGALGTELRAVNLRKEIADDLVDDLDHIVLKERRRLLLSRCCSLFDELHFFSTLGVLVENCRR